MLPYTLQDQIGFKIFVELQCKTHLTNPLNQYTFRADVLRFYNENNLQ